MSAVVHEAAPPEGRVQRCARCKAILTDYRNAMAPGPWSPSWWEGSVTVVSGNPTQYLSGVHADVFCEAT